MKKNNILKIFSIGVLVFCFASVALASTNIVASPYESRWAWNDTIGWIDFYSTGTVTVLSPGLQGYADSDADVVSLDCATSPAGDICLSGSDYQVINNGSGDLSGWAWNDAVGWISFCGGSSVSNCPGGVSYRVLIDPVTGIFSGWAWNDIVGWISFNCADPGVSGICGTSNYDVETTWAATSTSGYLDSSTFDTGVSGGAQINSVIWQGSMPSPIDTSSVSFQFAVSDSSSGPWDDADYHGPDGTNATYYETTSANSPYAIDYVLHNNARYFRYRITLTTNQTQTSSPRVDSVSVNWSR